MCMCAHCTIGRERAEKEATPVVRVLTETLRAELLAGIGPTEERWDILKQSDRFLASTLEARRRADPKRRILTLNIDADGLHTDRPPFDVTNTLSRP